MNAVRIKRRLPAFIVLCAVFWGLFAGCSKDRGDAPEQIVGDKTGSYASKPVPGFGNDVIESACLYGGEIYAYGKRDGGLYALLKTGETVCNTFADILAVVDGGFWTSGDWGEGIATTVKKVGFTGETILERELEDAGVIKEITADSEGNAYILTYDCKIFILSAEGERLHTLEMELNMPWNLAVSNGGAVYAMGTYADHSRFIEVGGGKKREALRLEGFDMYIHNGIGRYQFIFSDAEGLYGLKEDPAELVQIISWADSGIDYYPGSRIFPESENSFIVLSEGGLKRLAETSSPTKKSDAPPCYKRRHRYTP